MIILLISTEIETRWNPKTKKYYESLGYKYTKIGDPFFVKVSDLKDGSNERVLCKCDYCGEIFDIVWHSYTTLKKKKNNKDCCGNPKCTGLKAEESMLILHGVRNARELDSTNEKIKQTNLKNMVARIHLVTKMFKEKLLKLILKNMVFLFQQRVKK